MFVDEVTGGQAIHFSQSEESQCEKDGMQLQFSSKLAIPHSFKVLQVKGRNAGDPEWTTSPPDYQEQAHSSSYFSSFYLKQTIFNVYLSLMAKLPVFNSHEWNQYTKKKLHSLWKTLTHMTYVTFYN